MALLNVNRDVKDAFYRYKMPSIIAKVEGKGNGIKTVIVNMVDIAKALGRPPTYTCKYFGCELGAQTQFDIKNDRYIVNGSHDAPKLQDLLDSFIKKYVLCQECDNPETNLVVKKGTIGLICKACGHQGMADLRHKLCTYMIKNPPQTFGKDNAKDKKEKKKGKERESKDHSSEDDAKQNTKHHNGKHSKPKKAEKQPSEEDNLDDDWSVDVSEAAVAARMQEIAGMANITMNDDLEKTPTERADLLYTLVKTRLADGTIGKADKEIAAEAERLDIKNKAPLIVIEVLCNENMRDQIRSYKKHFLRLCHENKKAQKSLLGAVEKMIELHQSVLLPKTVHLLKELYDQDIVDEDVLLEWGEKPSKKYVSKELSYAIHEKAAPFMKWLREAEEESSDEEQEDEVEIVYSSKSEQQLQREEEALKQQEKAQNETDGHAEDDFDIDDI